jgi:hypothetical protein
LDESSVVIYTPVASVLKSYHQERKTCVIQ